MRVLYVSTEVYPALKTGGLADVNAALPGALVAAGADTRLLLPGFPALMEAATERAAPVRLGAAFGLADVSLIGCRIGRIDAWLIDAPAFYARAGNPYLGDDGGDWPDNALRFALLGWVAARFADGVAGDWLPDIVHGHDWHTGLALAYLRARGGDRPGTIFTVHNLAFQGQFDADTFASLGLPPHFFSMHGLEFHGTVNFMKSGLFYADRISTVSPTYAREIQTPQYGHGMDGLLYSRAGAVGGILNGIDGAEWNPRTDRTLAANFDVADRAGKAACKRALITQMGLSGTCSGPLIGVVSRMTAQKGLDLLLEALPLLIAGGAQVAVLGSGEPALEDAWLAAAAAHPDHIAVRRGYDEALAHRIIAGADLIALPSRFEPCGLTQMYGMAYGTLPLARRTGGLADTIRDADAGNSADGSATGFLFDAATLADLRGALDRMFALWRRPGQWQRMQRAAMHRRFGWDDAARHYLALYRELRPYA